jgi:hypothetical protein
MNVMAAAILTAQHGESATLKWIRIQNKKRCFGIKINTS